MLNYKYLRVEKLNNGLAIIQLDRPEAKNALSSLMVGEISDAVGHLEDDESVYCVIFKGDTNFFIAGADIKEMIGINVIEAYTISSEMKALHNKIITSSKPYIAAIQGYCLGGGLELALACDIRIADYTAKFGLPEINLGIIPGAGGIQRILELTGISFASQFIMTGEIIDAKQAEKLLIVNNVTENVVDEAIAIGCSISEKSRIAISVIKKLINQKKLQNHSLELEGEILQFSQLFDQPDSLEGMSAFLEKRKPKFKGGITV